MSSACLRDGECLEVPEPGKQEVDPEGLGQELGLLLRRAWRAMTAGMAISRNRIVRGSQARAGASARASSWEKASRPAGQGHDQAPDTVLSEPLQGEAVKPGVFRAADAVLAAGP